MNNTLTSTPRRLILALVAAGAVVLGIWPGIIDHLAGWLFDSRDSTASRPILAASPMR